MATANGEERFGNRFAVEALIGSGISGALFRAKDRVSGSSVALKVMPPLERKAAERFPGEVEVLNRLNHPAIVHHVAHGLTPQLQPFFASEWLVGENLGQRLSRGGLAPDLVARLGARVLQALAAANREGLIHGGIKPSKLFLPDQDPARAIVTDLGVGLCKSGVMPISETGVMTGPWYLAPEQVQVSGVLDGRADIFSLGCVLYECVTGRCLIPESIWNSDGPHEGFTGLCAAVPQPLRAILERMLATDRDDRPADPERLSSELLEVARVLEGIATRFAIAVSPLGDFRVLFEKGPREAPRTLAGRTIPCFGREREFDLLEGLWHEVCKQSVARALIISAPAGGGKTRLRQELCDRIKRHGPAFELLVGHGDPMLDGAPLSLLGPAILSAAGLTGGEVAREKQQRLTAEVEHVLPPGQAQRVAAFLGEMAHAPFPDELPLMREARLDPRLMADQIRMAWIDWLEALCNRHPVMLVLEDLHWGDSASVALAETALRVLHDKPLLLMALTQPEVDQRFMNLWRERSPQRIHLAPLSARQSQRLIEYVAGPLTAAVAREMVEGAQGNPFFIEESLRVVLGGGNKRPERSETALGMVQTRIQALPPEPRLVLGACSVLGRRFRVDAVKAMVEGDGPMDVERCLNLLEDQEILFSYTSMAGREFSFRHALIRQAAYDMLPLKERRLGHLWAGRFLEQTGETDARALAEHFERGRDQPRAIHWLRRATEQSLHADDLTGTLHLAQRALKLGAHDEDEKALRVNEAQIHLWHEEHPEAERAALAAVSSQAAETRWQAMRCLLAALAAQSKTEDLGRLLVPIAEPPERSDLIGCWLDCLSSAIPFLVTAQGEQVRTRVRPRLEGLLTADAPWVGKAESVVAQLAWATGRPTEAQAGFVRAAQRHASLGNRRAECEARFNLGRIMLVTGQLEKAEDCLRPLLESVRRLELALLSGMISETLARVLAYREAWDEARELGLRAISLAVNRKDRRLQGNAEIALALTELLAGNYPSAEKFAIAGAASVEMARTGRSLAQAMLARALLAQARTSEALQHARAAYAQLDNPPGIDGAETTTHLAMAECLLATGDTAAAHEVLRRACSRLRDRADTITDSTVRRSFLAGLPEHARLLQLCHQANLEALAEP